MVQQGNRRPCQANLNHRIIIFLTLFIISLQLFSVTAQPNPQPQTPSENDTVIVWYEGSVQHRASMAFDEVAVFPGKGKALGLQNNPVLLTQRFHPQADVTASNDFVIIQKSPAAFTRAGLQEKLVALRSSSDIRQSSPVFYTGAQKSPETRMALTGSIIVQFPPELEKLEIQALEKGYGLQRVRPLPPAANTFLYQAGDALQSLDAANQLHQSGHVVYAYPNWLRGRTTRAVPDDSLFADQWHLQNTGQGGGLSGEDVNIIAVWDTYQGSSNEVVAIVDDGLEIAHEDLTANLITGASWDYVDSDTDPTAGDHGTSCAGVTTGRGFNTQGVSGAAPLAGLVGFRLLGAGTDANEADALSRDSQQIDIYSNSWGPNDDGQRLEGPGPLTEDALEHGITTGRGGLGSVYVWAGGNGYDADNANYDGYANSRYTIAVAASTNSGTRSSYSEKGANIVVNAPSSGGTLGITTTDRSGSTGYSSGNYTDSFGGTSSAAPLVSGIVALMLQANPNLTWREVQRILIETAGYNDPADTDWITNGAGYRVNHKYGFGRVDALAGVRAAEEWTSIAAETATQGSSNPNLPIPDNDATGIADTITIPGNIYIEYVDVYFTADDHTYWGDLEVTLTSPDGTQSVLSEKHSCGGDTARYDNWRFGTARPFGEASQGDWTLRVKDLWADDTGTFQAWTLKIYGTTRPYLCGNIGGRTLRAADSPYIVTCDLRVDAGQAAVIESGVELTNFDNYSFTVKGGLTWYP